MTTVHAAPPAERAYAPDLARGAMLLLIAVANVHLYLYGHPVGVRGYPADLEGFDRWLALIQAVVVDGRAYPLFGLMFGYGIAQLADRGRAAGRTEQGTVALVRRRGAVMLAMGLLHGVLLWPGDFLGLYGVLALVMAGLLVRGRDTVLIAVAVAGLLLCTLLYAGSAFPGVPGQVAFLPSMAEPDPRAAVLARSAEWSSGMINTVALFGAVAAGAWAARRRMLDEPERHRRALRIATAGGLTAAIIGGLPLGLLAADVWADAPPGAVLAAGALHSATGYAGGIGYAAAFGLVAIRVRRSPGPGHLVAALVACGQRSLSAYLAQSLVFVSLFPAWTLARGEIATLTQATVVGIATWAAVLGCAAGAERARGPAERALRRMTYGSRSRRPTGRVR